MQFYHKIKEGKERIIAYFSRVLSKTERNYCVTRRELLVIVDSIKFFRHYLLGRKFLIRTDHVFLKWLLSFKDLEGQLTRWLERLQLYEFKIVHRKGQIHKDADGLSKRQCESIGCEYCVRVERKNMEELQKSVTRIILTERTFQDWKKEQLEDPNISLIYRGKEAGIRPLRSEIPNVSTEMFPFEFTDPIGTH